MRNGRAQRTPPRSKSRCSLISADNCMHPERRLVMRYIPLCLVLLAGCASVTPESLQKMSIAEACYLGRVEPEKQQMVNDEVRRRNEDCAQHKAEIDRISAMESRAAAESGQG